MAAKQAPNGMDYNAHESSYAGFITLLKWGTIAALAATAFVVVLLAR